MYEKEYNIWSARYLYIFKIYLKYYFKLFWGNLGKIFHYRCSVTLTTHYDNTREFFKCWVSLIKRTVQVQYLGIIDISKLHDTVKSCWRAYLSSVSDKWHFASFWLPGPLKISIILLRILCQKMNFINLTLQLTFKKASHQSIPFSLVQFWQFHHQVASVPENCVDILSDMSRTWSFFPLCQIRDRNQFPLWICDREHVMPLQQNFLIESTLSFLFHAHIFHKGHIY